MRFVRHTVAAWASLCLVLTACGGGSSGHGETDASPAPVPVAASASAAPAQAQYVQIEGCVVDQHDQAHATRVQAFGGDGHLVATGSSTADGVFTLLVPARQNLRVGLATPGTDAFDVLTGSTRLSLGACLRERAA